MTAEARGGALAKEAPVMPQRERGWAVGSRGPVKQEGPWRHSPAPPPGPGTKACVAQLRLIKCHSPAPSVLSGWFWPRPRPGNGGRGGSGTRAPEDPEGPRPVGDPGSRRAQRWLQAVLHSCEDSEDSRSRPHETAACHPESPPGTDSPGQGLSIWRGEACSRGRKGLPPLPPERARSAPWLL